MYFPGVNSSLFMGCIFALLTNKSIYCCGIRTSIDYVINHKWWMNFVSIQYAIFSLLLVSIRINQWLNYLCPTSPRKKINRDIDKYSIYDVICLVACVHMDRLEFRWPKWFTQYIDEKERQDGDFFIFPFIHFPSHQTRRWGSLCWKTKAIPIFTQPSKAHFYLTRVNYFYIILAGKTLKYLYT